ncbi:MAG: ferritin [Anaerolineaceae bacterium]
MLSTTISKEMNEQIKHEFFSAYLYLSMAAYAESINMAGVANWYKLQAEEEMEHGMKFFEYILDRGGKIELQAIDKPQVKFTSVKETFDLSYAHEQKVTARINLIYSLAVKESDYASQAFLQWFVTEQVEEEKNASQIAEMLAMIGENTNGLFALDHQLSKRKKE